MNSAYHKGAHQQACHAPKRPEDPGIFLRVMVCGMGQITRETFRRARMTFLAGGNDILAAQGRMRINNRENFMRAVAIVAFGRFLISQFCHLPVKSFKICVRDIQVALSADIHDLNFKHVLVCPLDAMRGMTIAADRQSCGVFAFAVGMNTAYIFFVDTFVALGAGRGDIITVDGGLRVAGRKFLMGGMTVGAHGGHHEPAF